jgi:outer membrane immunogenic protein
MRGAVIVVAGIATTFAVPAHAQEMGWSGFYVGADAGMGSTDADISSTEIIVQLTNINAPGRGLIVVPGTSRPLSASDKKTDLVYGGLAGAQFQTGAWVFGVEGDLHGPRELPGASQTYAMPPTALAPASTAVLTRSVETSYDWSARARIGYAFGRSMVYAQGGVAGAQVEMTGVGTWTTPAGNAPADANGNFFASPTIGPVVITLAQKKSMLGWTAGIGGERRLSRWLGIGLDARYTDFGKKTLLDQTCEGGFPAFPYNVANGRCPGGTLTAAPFVIPGRGTAVYTDTNFALPGAIPSPTVFSLNEWRLTARIVLHFSFGG